ncbi:hypothetical protein [Mesonia sp. K4-1]|uniref:hypothetical protein n=1 Tax=Mesonia sp. K4-1 TaxID=2602760 RepID=UPI0011CA3A89|nr:hypothetical protein [Mesonia sp. K4-1]TXK71963.1 hypothetical protein FT986_15015 [Mesonia sp. K4-1]
MTLEQIINNIPVINEDQNYWFIRTDGGDNYDVFRDNNFVAIGWDYLDNRHLPVMFQENQALRQRIVEKENAIYKAEDNPRRLNDGGAGDKATITKIINTVKRFSDLRKNDIVVIPSSDTKNLSFGYIQDESVYIDANDDRCERVKRRRVKWVAHKSMSELDDAFLDIKTRHGTITNLENLSIQINRVVNKTFIKGEKIHHVLNVEMNGDIPTKHLNELNRTHDELVEFIINEFNFDIEGDTNSYLAVNVQSPGFLDLYRNKQYLKAIALVVLLSSCTNEEHKNKIDESDLIMPSEQSFQILQQKVDSFNKSKDLLNVR